MASVFIDSVFQQMEVSRAHSAISEYARQPYHQSPELLSKDFNCVEGVAITHGTDSGVRGQGRYPNSDNGKENFVSVTRDIDHQRISPQKDGADTNDVHTNDNVLKNDDDSRSHINDVKMNATASKIIDIRRDQTQLCLAQMVRESLRSPIPRPPSLALWDDRGLGLFERVTRLPEYCLSHVEKEIIEKNCLEIASKIEPESMIVGLGCGYVVQTGACAYQSLSAMDLDLSIQEYQQADATTQLSRHHGPNS